MTSTQHFDPCLVALRDHDDSFKLVGPLTAISPDERADYFIESEIAHDQYLAHRSHGVPAGVVTYHVIHESGEVVGFISFRVGTEMGVGSSRIFNSIEYVYVRRTFRMRGLGTHLLVPLLQEMRALLHQATGEGRKPRVYIHSASQPESKEGDSLIRQLEERLSMLASRCRGVILTGRHVEYPPGASQRLWSRQIAPTSHESLA